MAVALTAACGPSATGVAPATPPQSPGASAPARVEGVVRTATSSSLTLADGTILELSPSTRVIRVAAATPADLKPGMFVAITARRQPDNTLLASMVSIFSESQSRIVPPGQRPLPEGNLMTNAPIASIDQVSGTTFTVTVSGGGATVTLAPDARILKQVDLKPEAILAGAKVSATVVNGAAQSVQIQSQ